MNLRQLHHTEVCTLSGQGKILNPYATHYGRHSLFPRSHTHLPNSFPCGLPAIAELLAWADKWVYRVPRRRHEQFRFCLFAGSRIVRVPRQLNGASDCMPFWPKPVSAFGLFAVTAFISNSHALTMLPNLVPHPP